MFHRRFTDIPNTPNPTQKSQQTEQTQKQLNQHLRLLLFFYRNNFSDSIPFSVIDCLTKSIRMEQYMNMSAASILLLFSSIVHQFHHRFWFAVWHFSTHNNPQCVDDPCAPFFLYRQNPRIDHSTTVLAWIWLRGQMLTHRMTIDMAMWTMISYFFFHNSYRC